MNKRVYNILFILLFTFSVSFLFMESGYAAANLNKEGTTLVCSYKAEYITIPYVKYGVTNQFGNIYINIYYNTNTEKWAISSSYLIYYNYGEENEYTSSGNFKTTDWKSFSYTFSTSGTSVYMLDSSESSLENFNCPNYAYLFYNPTEFCFANSLESACTRTNMYYNPDVLYLNSSYSIPSSSSVSSSSSSATASSSNYTSNVDYENFCSQNNIQAIMKLVGYLITIIKIIVPLLLIIMGSVDFAKSVMSGDDKQMNKSISSLVMRIVSAIIIFFIPTIIKIVFNIIDSDWTEEEGYYQCVACVLDTSECGN